MARTLPAATFEGNRSTDGSAVPSRAAPSDAVIAVKTDTGVTVAYFAPDDDLTRPFEDPGLFYTIELLDDISLKESIYSYMYTIEGNGHTLRLDQKLPDGYPFIGVTSMGGDTRLAAFKNLTIDLGGNADYALGMSDCPNQVLVDACRIVGAKTAGIECSSDMLTVRDTEFVLEDSAIANIELIGPGHFGVSGIKLEDSNEYVERLPVALMTAKSLGEWADFLLVDSHAAVAENLDAENYLNLPLHYDEERDVATTDVPEQDKPVDVDIIETEGGSVEVAPVKPGEKAVIEAKPDKGQEVRDVVVTDAEGVAVKVSQDKDGVWSFTMPENGATVTVLFGCDGGELCETHTFSDVDQSLWYHDAVDWAVAQGVMNGYEGTSLFGPADTLTRAQAAAVLYNYLANGDTSADDAPFSDVAQDAWYSEPVNWVIANGIMNGYEGSDRFGVNDALTREQFCAVIANAVDADLSQIDDSVLDAFPDADTVSAWARPAVAWVVQSGVINGVELGDGTRALDVVRNIARSEMAAMMQNAVESGVLKG